MKIKFTDKTTHLELELLDDSFIAIPDTLRQVVTPMAGIREIKTLGLIAIDDVNLTPAPQVNPATDFVDGTNTPFNTTTDVMNYLQPLFQKFIIGSSISGGGGGDATAANQTSGDQKTQIVDSGAINGVKVTNNSLQVFVANNPTVSVPDVATETTLSAILAGQRISSRRKTLFDAKHLYSSKLPYLFDDVVSGAGAASTANYNNIAMSVTNNGEYVIRQTFRKFNYTSGNPMLYFFTAYNMQPQINVTKRLGCFDSSTVAPYSANLDGAFIESADTDTYFKVYKDGTELFSSQLVGYNFTNGQVFLIRYLWLGYAFCELYIEDNNGNAVLVTGYYPTGGIDEPFFKNPNKPIRYEIRSSGGAGQMNQVCSSVDAEDLSDLVGIDYAIDSGNASISLVGTSNHVAGAIRLASGRENATVNVKEFNPVSRSNDDVLWQVVMNPTFSAPIVFTANGDYNSEYYIGNGTITATYTQSQVIYSDIIRAGQSVQAVIDGLRKIGSKIDGTRDVLAIIARPFTSPSEVGFTLNLTDL